MQQESKMVPIKSEEESKIIHQSAEETTTTEVEKKYVYEIYDKIAPHFSSTRYKPWPKIELFLKSLEPGSLVGDVGCGNGKYLGVNNEISMIGIDRSLNLIKICKERDASFEVLAGDGLNLPWRDGVFDAVISIAVIHHLSNNHLRK
jgi:alkylated DNA repair protein alkB family protein 8